MAVTGSGSSRGRRRHASPVVASAIGVVLALLATSCMVGGRWTEVVTPSMERAGLFSRGLSCPTRDFCMAVESGGDFDIDSGLMSWNGSTWSFDHQWDDTLAVRDVQCSSPTACWVWLQDKGRDFFRPVGTDGVPAPWPVSVEDHNPGFLEQPAMSCVPSGCVFLGDGTTTWDGTRYHVHVAAGPTPRIRALSCTSTSDCIGTGFLDPKAGVTPAYRWNGTAWSLIPVIPPRPPTTIPTTTFEPLDLSCSTQGGCMAVGERIITSSGQRIPAAAHWDGSSWTALAVPLAGLGRLSSVSCANGVECLAVGALDVAVDDRVAVALVWTGTSWLTAAGPPGSEHVAYTQASCPAVRGWCMAVGADGPPGEVHDVRTAVFTWT